MPEVTIAQMLSRFEALDLERLTGDAMERKQDDIVDLNREQMNEGVKSDGRDISPKYSVFTVNEKLKKGQAFDKVTLKDTGAFQNRMALNVKGTTFSVTSTDSKTGKLVEKYGVEIFGLSPSGLKEAWIIVKPDVVEMIKQETGAI